ncbi:MAG: IS200/IS605 family transposase [Candidatus Altiarchaeales archaeon]|nr:IS200/IS605 family transposase [Candidatus Altiarchaeales archaeon]
MHLLVDLEPNYRVCEFANLLKGRSARRILKEYPEIKQKYFWGSGFWNPSYYFDSVGDTNTQKMEAYVRNQKLTRKPDPGQKKLSDFLAG